jgi:hypothetical protein
MKSFASLSIAAVLICTTLSCKKEGCTDATATNYNSEAKKDDGSCTYPPVVDPRDAFLGNYSVIDSGFGGGTTFVEAVTYTLSLTTNGTASDTIYLNNLSNNGKNYFSILSGSTFTIPSQTEAGPYTLYGSGSFSGSQITYSTYSGPGNNYLNEGSGSK